VPGAGAFKQAASTRRRRTEGRGRAGIDECGRAFKNPAPPPRRHDDDQQLDPPYPKAPPSRMIRIIIVRLGRPLSASSLAGCAAARWRRLEVVEHAPELGEQRRVHVPLGRVDLQERSSADCERGESRKARTTDLQVDDVPILHRRRRCRVRPVEVDALDCRHERGLGSAVCSQGRARRRGTHRGGRAASDPTTCTARTARPGR
jgi:hypothetical protein